MGGGDRKEAFQSNTCLLGRQLVSVCLKTN